MEEYVNSVSSGNSLPEEELPEESFDENGSGVVDEETSVDSEQENSSQDDNQEQSIVMLTSEEYYDTVYNAVNDAIVANQVVTDGQAISNTALEYFKGVLCNELPFIDYVVYCGEPYTYTYYDGQRTAYEYCMAYGDLECSGDYFSGTADVVTIRTVGEYSVSYMNDQAISLYAPQYYSRSNLGNYSGIVAYDYLSLGILALMAIGGVLWFLSGIFGFRRR